MNICLPTFLLQVFSLSTPIENKGCLMMFDELLDVDMDEMIYAYYGGMLGTATKHLPLRMHAPYAHDSFSDYDFKWTLNSNGYPIKKKKKRSQVML